MKQFCLGLLLLMVSAQLLAETALSASQVRIRLPLPGQTTAVVYLQLTNAGDEARLLQSVSVEGAAVAELHQHIHRDGMMRMRRLQQLTVSPREVVSFEPGGYHIMAFRMDTGDVIKARRSIGIILRFANGESLQLQAQPVRL